MMMCEHCEKTIRSPPTTSRTWGHSDMWPHFLMNLLTQDEVIAQLGVSRQLFSQSIRPLMQREGDAKPIGKGKRAVWVYDGNQIWRWKEYIEKRNALIEIGHPDWHSKRPYDLGEMNALVDQGVFDGEIEHPAFRLTA